ncbi:MAG: glucosylceramidase [Bacteroidales bacterium]|nr:glucosylceramidase [Bacteroidales bacterium]
MKNRIGIFFLLTGASICLLTCSQKEKAKIWITTGDEGSLLQESPGAIVSGSDSTGIPSVRVNRAIKYQVIDGFGFSLTGGSAMLINNLPPSPRKKLLDELFGKSPGSAGISYIRISIGSSDLDPEVFSYSDMPEGESDTALTHFSLSRDTLHLIPVLKEILAISPGLKIMGSPWSAPVWMKDNGKSVGGSLKPEYYRTYARYFAKYIRSMQENGIIIDAVTVQNEPQHGGNNPSMVMSSSQQAEFIRNHLGPVFRKEGITTKIIIWDHNCDLPSYPIDILNDSEAKQYIDGTAFHLYAGDISALSEVKEAHPDRHLYFTEQWTGARGSFDGDLLWHVKNVLIGSVRNWSRLVLEWNLANDPEYDPHTPGGCNQCKGALTIDGDSVSRNVSYYIISHASAFVAPGSVRIESNMPEGVPNVAFLRPDGKIVVIALNEGKKELSFHLACEDTGFNVKLLPRSVATIVLE